VIEFELTEDQIALREMARDFAAQQAALVPFAASVRAAVAGLGN